MISYERGYIEELRELKRKHMNSGLSTIKVLVVYEVDKNENVKKGNISISYIVNIAKDRENEPVKLFGSVGATVYGAENIDRLIGGKLNKLLETGNKNIAKLFEMEKEQYDKFKTTDRMEVHIYHGDCKYY